MSVQTSMTVEKRLHHKNAFVQAITYASLEKPKLLEIITVGGSITVGSRGKTLIRTSVDNGKNWEITGEWQPEESNIETSVPTYFLDPDHNILVEFFTEAKKWLEGEEMSHLKAVDLSIMGSQKIYYRFSKDEGRTWSPKKQLIQKGYTEDNWAEGIRYGKNGGSFGHLLRVTKLRDGSLMVPFNFLTIDEKGDIRTPVDRFGLEIWPTEGCASFRGTWKEDLSDIEWDVSNLLAVPEYISRSLCEPAVAEMDNGVLMMLMRGCSGPTQAIPSVKFFSVSKDKGKTWGPAVPLTYPDSSYVYSPGSVPNLFRSSKNDKVYIIANILPEPTKSCDPRYPLKIAEIDKEYLWVKAETETVIEDRQERHPRFVRFSNWAWIEDRETGNPVVFLTEARVDEIIPDEGTVITDSYRYEVQLPM